ncbi:MAG: efflux RND transporter periplasmic adaptor subunit [Saprospiraceae bacterium]|nr:efflux RND transporter periplasmic adaptor subunit [Saprospiraceae bacterium]
MKNKIYITLYSLLIIAIIGLTNCKHDHSEDGHDHGQTSDHIHDEVDEHKEKEVHLNFAQYENAGIDTGWFEMKNLSDIVNANGYTKLDPQDEAEVNVAVSGIIQSINVIEGNYVKKGQVLAKMTSLEYNKMLLEEAQLEERYATLKEQILFFEKEYERQRILSENNINAKKIVEKTGSDLKTSSVKINSLQNQLNILRQTIKIVGYSNGSTISIVAPISGYVTHVDAKIGTLVQPGVHIFSIVDNSKMHVDLLIYEKDLSLVKVGQTVRFILTNQSNREIKGEIYNVGKSFANETKSVAVHADIEENDANLIPGMYINALIDIGDNMVQTLPEEAIINAEGRKFIFALLQDSNHKKEASNQSEEEVEIEFRRIEVSTGASQLGVVEVSLLGVIPEGGKIVTKGAYYIQSHLQKTEGGGGHSH